MTQFRVQATEPGVIGPRQPPGVSAVSAFYSMARALALSRYRIPSTGSVSGGIGALPSYTTCQILGLDPPIGFWFLTAPQGPIPR